MSTLDKDKRKVPLLVTITYEYEADVFPDDPDDIYEIAKLEELALTDGIFDAVERLDGYGIEFSIKPVINITTD